MRQQIYVIYYLAGVSYHGTMNDYYIYIHAKLLPVLVDDKAHVFLVPCSIDFEGQKEVAS